MKNEDKFFNLLNRIDNELDKLKSLNDNLSQINNYVIEVSSIKENILNIIKELILEYQKNQNNLKTSTDSLFNLLSKLNDNIKEQIAYLSQNSLKTYEKIDNLFKQVNNELIKKITDSESSISNTVKQSSSIIVKNTNSLIQQSQKNLVDLNKKEFYVIDKKFKLITIIIILNAILTISNLIMILISK